MKATFVKPKRLMTRPLTVTLSAATVCPSEVTGAIPFSSISRTALSLVSCVFAIAPGCV